MYDEYGLEEYHIEGTIIMPEIKDVESLVAASDKVINHAGNIFSWFEKPHEEARSYLIKLIENSELAPEEASSLIYNSRKLIREYANSKSIYEQAKKRFSKNADEEAIDEDWLHFFFDKAQKVSNKGLQFIWANLLAGEYNKPGSISRKLMHIISIMDANSAHSFQTISQYVFMPKLLFEPRYSTETIIIPVGFYTDSFDFRMKAERWLKKDGFNDYSKVAGDVTMTEGELNDLENLGLVQCVQEASVKTPVLYTLPNSRTVCIVPQDDDELPCGKYAFTSEGNQLYSIICPTGNEAALAITIHNLQELNFRFDIT